MVRIIIHCGMPKSGTTALQNLLDANQAALLEQGILYPRSGRFGERHANHHAFFLSSSKNPELARTPLPAPRYSSQLYVQQLRREMDSSGAKTVILSSEMLFGPAFVKHSLNSIKNALGFANVTVYCVLRNQVDFIESAFAQRVTGRQRYSGTPRSHLRDLEDDAVLDYDERILQFERVFGKESVKLCWYEDVRDNISEPLYNLAGIRSNDLLRSARRENVRRTWFFVFCLRWMRRLSFLDQYRTGLRTINKLEKALCAIGAKTVLDRAFKPYSSLEKERLNMQYARKNENIRARHELYWWREPSGCNRG